jgi:hypothetical protein
MRAVIGDGAVLCYPTACLYDFTLNLRFSSRITFRASSQVSHSISHSGDGRFRKSG